MRDLAIDARGAQKTFGKGSLAFHALKGVDFPVGRGEFVTQVVIDLDDPKGLVPGLRVTGYIEAGAR